MEGFTYVVDKTNANTNIAFGKCNRDCKYQTCIPYIQPICGTRSYPGPSDHISHKVWAVKPSPLMKRYTKIITKTPSLSRMKSRAPFPGKSDPYKSNLMKQSYKPFGTSLPARPSITALPTSPFSYASQGSNTRKPKINSAFGSRHEICPEIKVICTPFNISKCYICQERPLGDYWRNYDTKRDMCRPCRNKKLNYIKQYGVDKSFRMMVRRELDQYEQVRHCGFYHNHHGGATGSIKLMSLAHLRLKIRTENYLSLYMKK